MTLPLRSVLLLLLLPALVLAGCERSAPPSTAATPPAAASTPLEGVVPQKEGAPAASDRPGVAAIGAVEAGQASGGAAVGQPAETTAGDGRASTAASAPASGPK